MKRGLPALPALGAAPGLHCDQCMSSRVPVHHVQREISCNAAIGWTKGATEHFCFCLQMIRSCKVAEEAAGAKADESKAVAEAGQEGAQ